MTNKLKHMHVVIGLGIALVVQPAAAIIDDSPYFNLWTEGVVSAGATGDGSTVSLCGTSACSGTATAIDFAIFKTVMDPDTGRGSGAIDPFLRFQHNEGIATGAATIERAFNTSNDNIGTISEDGGIMYENQAKDSVAGGAPRDSFNHAIKLSDLMAVDGLYSFLLDINEPNGSKSLLRFDELALFVSTTDQLNEFDRGDGTLDSLQFDDDDGLAYKVGDMDFNSLAQGTDETRPPRKNLGGLNLDNINDTGPAGSGDYDMEQQLHKALFDRVIAAAQAGGSTITADNAYVYLYNWAGEETVAGPGPKGDPDDGEAQAGFEEWAVVVNTVPDEEPPGGEIPEPATALLLLGGLAGMTRYRRRRRG